MDETPIPSIVYGPVPSWRLGRSLGIDPVSTKGKTCSFDCIYCQLGRTVHPLTERRRFVAPDALRQQLAAIGNVAIDTVTFSGVAEPTLAVNLGELVAVVREAITQHPVAILTNASLIWRQDVQTHLRLFDIVAAKVDAPTEDLFQAVNRPVGGIPLAQIIDGIREFRDGFAGKLALQMMFVKANRDQARQMAALARTLRPDEVQLNTPLRPCPVHPLSATKMAAIESEFAGLPTINVYTAKRPQVVPVDMQATRRRRPRESRIAGPSVQESESGAEDKACVATAQTTPIPSMGCGLGQATHIKTR
jgi:wyosine [tRNA(Phe)-imidazoG37] synthetase (radical SAM superfamily)